MIVSNREGVCLQRSCTTNRPRIDNRGSTIYLKSVANVAQSAEHRFRKAGVKGSTPFVGFSRDGIPPIDSNPRQVHPYENMIGFICVYFVCFHYHDFIRLSNLDATTKGV